MIKRKTVLVLGAGASKPYGFKLGGELTNYIYKELAKETTQLFSLLVDLDFSPTHIIEFRRELRRSKLRSVDRFLEQRSEFREVGKTAIAACLIEGEAEENLYPSEGDWHAELWERLGPKLEDIGNSHLSVVTFNYDRSFDQFLYQAFKSTFGLSDQRVTPYLQYVPIVHVYGQLGALPHQDPASGRAYQPPAPGQWATEAGRAREGIKIVSEGGEDDRELRVAREWIGGAESVCFLGFGYLPKNVERLGLRQRSGDPHLWGSAFDVRDDERQRIKVLFRTPELAKHEINLGGRDEDVLECLRQHAFLQ